MTRLWITLLVVLIVRFYSVVYAAAPTVSETNTKTASVSNDTITLSAVTAGNGVGVAYLLTSASNRVVSSVTGDNGDSMTSLGSQSCGAATDCVDLWADFSSAGGGSTVTYTLDQSGTFQQYEMVVFEFDCQGGTCSLDTAGSAGFQNTPMTSTPFMSPSGELDTAANALLVGACVGTASFGTRTPTTGFQTDTTNLSAATFWQYEDDVSSAFTDERQQWSHVSARVSECRGWSIKFVSSGGSTPHVGSLGMLGIGK